MYSNNNIRLFWEKVEKQDGDSCWEWTGAKNSDGYGHMNINGKLEKAHRMAWELEHDYIPAKKCICHICDNPSCVNPCHLFIATHAENMNDMKLKGRAYGHLGENNYKAKLSEDDIREIRSQYRTGSYGLVKKLAEKYCVHKSTIHLIVTHKTWAHVL